MWKRILLVVLILVIIISIVELYFCRLQYRTLLDLSDLNKFGIYHGSDGDILVSTKAFKVLPNGYYPIKPTMLIASQIESGIESALTIPETIKSHSFLTDSLTTVYPFVEFMSMPKYTTPQCTLNFASNNPNLKIIMSKKHDKEYFYVR